MGLDMYLNKTKRIGDATPEQLNAVNEYFSYLKDSSNVVRNITFFTKGEDKHLAVACASLISRYIFINEFNKLKSTIENSDVDTMKELMKLSTLRRSYFNKK